MEMENSEEMVSWGVLEVESEGGEEAKGKKMAPLKLFFPSSFTYQKEEGNCTQKTMLCH